MLAQNLPGGFKSATAISHFRQSVVLNLGDIHRRVPGCKGRRGSDQAGDLVGQSFHIIAEDGTVIGVSVKIEVPPSRPQFVFHRAQ